MYLTSNWSLYGLISNELQMSWKHSWRASEAQIQKRRETDEKPCLQDAGLPIARVPVCLDNPCK